MATCDSTERDGESISRTKSRPTGQWPKRHIMDTQLAETGRRIETLDEEQYTKFVTERLEQCTTPVTQTLHTKKLPLFSRQPAKVMLKQKAGLFLRMYISCQTRDRDMDNFFSHENQAAPPALLTGGKCCLELK